MFILVRLIQHVSSIIMLVVRRTDYTKNCLWSMPCCVGCSRVDLGHELCALFGRWYTTVLRDSNPQSHQAIGRRPTPQTGLQLGSVVHNVYLQLLSRTRHGFYFSLLWRNFTINPDCTRLLRSNYQVLSLIHTSQYVLTYIYIYI